MKYINWIAFAMVLLSIAAFVAIKRSYKVQPFKSVGKDENEDSKLWLIMFWSFIGLALVIRVICGIKFNVHTDLSCFNYWSDLAYSTKFSKFYESAEFADYPPGYMYILWVVALIKHLFGIETYSPMGTLMIKSPAIVFDFITAAIIYKIAKKNLNKKSAFICFLLYLFNPIVILNSAVWGQVDSVFALGIFLMCYFIYTDRTKYAYICYGFSVLIKPQAFMFTPILMLALLEEVFLKHDDVILKDGRLSFKFNFEKFKEQGLWALGSMAATIVFMLPFKIGTVIEKYFSTMASYPYVTVNAYNLWGMFGLDWADQTKKLFGLEYKQWGTIFIIAICFTVVWIWLAKIKERSRYLVMTIFISCAMFTVAVRMHERYVYPGVIILLLLFIFNKHKSALWLFVLYSIAHFYNAAHVLFYYDATNFNATDQAIVLISMLHVIVFGLFMMYVIKRYCRADKPCLDVVNSDGEPLLIDGTLHLKEEEVKEDVSKKNEAKGNKRKNNMNKKNETKANKSNIEDKSLSGKISDFFSKKVFMTNTVELSEKKVRMTKTDWIILAVITVIYAAIALYDLGDTKVPEKYWETKEYFTDINIELPEGTTISRIAFYLGNYESRSFTLNTAAKKEGEWTNSFTETTTDADGKTTENSTTIQTTGYTMDSVFCWADWNVKAQARYLKLSSQSDCCVIGELVIFDENNRIVRPVNADDKALKGLFDEQDRYPERYSFRNSTYFDEIYHARTAYEYMHGLYSYENTHPPLGKIFIALGMVIFGVCPFGWRIAGTVFGIIMIPIIYLFAKKLFKRTDIATVTCILLTFDFMHFVQTRIATIDVFVTFFIMLMYFFMYKYYTMSFYDNKLSKTFIPLGLSAVSMGLGCASKWTGCYAGAGLGVVFFIVMYKRFCEYRYAKLNIDGETNGIKHSHIVEVFKKYFWYTCLYCVGTFLVLAGTIYTLSYIPFRHGNFDADKDYAIGRIVDKLVKGDNPPIPESTLVGRMLGNIDRMYSYHSKIEFTHPYSSRWYEWPIMIKPIWYYSGETGDKMREGISAFGNPLVWWLGVPAFLFIIYQIVKKKDKMALFLGIGYLAQVLPWVLVKRLTFIYHYFPSVPFVVLMLGYSIYKILEKKPERKKYMYIYAAAVVILFIMFYPVLAGQSVSINYVSNWLRWFPSWQLISY